MSAGQQRSGWYTDPWGQGAQRWWDGQRRTAHLPAGPAG